MAKDGNRILFPDVEVEGYTIRPWTLGQAVDLAAALGTAVDIIGASGAGKALSGILESIEPENTTIDNLGKALLGGWKDVVRALPSIVPKFLPLAPKVLSVSLGVSVEEVAMFDLGKTARLLQAVGVQNYAYLKNFFGPERVTAATKTT